MRLVLIIAAITGCLALANRWAGQANAVRVDPWLEATSPHTAQTYLVHSSADHGQLHGFALESGAPYRFTGCVLPPPGESVRCPDQAGTVWTLAP